MHTYKIKKPNDYKKKKLSLKFKQIWQQNMVNKNPLAMHVLKVKYKNWIKIIIVDY